MVATRDFSGLVSSACALANAAARQAMDSLNRCMAALLDEEVEAHGAGFRALGPNAMADRLLGILRHQALELGLGLLVLDVGRAGPGKDAGELRQVLEPLISTIRIRRLERATMKRTAKDKPPRSTGAVLML